MDSEFKILIATSIAPRNFDRQMAAVVSWQTLGFEVISVNLVTEISNLEKLYPSVEFLPIDKLDKIHTTRDLVYFDQVLDALKEKAWDVSGIINSDILLRADQSFQQSIINAAKGSIVFGSRIDINSADETTGEIWPHGYDFFFFDREVLNLYPKSPFRIGAPWWDIWASIVPSLSGVATKLLVDPVAFHVRHKGQWEHGPEWDKYGHLLIENLAQFGHQYFSKYQEKLKTDKGLSWLSFCHFLTMRQFDIHWNVYNKLSILHAGTDNLSEYNYLISRNLFDAIANGIPQHINSVSEKIEFEKD